MENTLIKLWDTIGLSGLLVGLVHIVAGILSIDIITPVMKFLGYGFMSLNYLWVIMFLTLIGLVWLYYFIAETED